MTRTGPRFPYLIVEDILCGVLDIPRCHDQIGGGHQADELRNQQIAPLHIVVDPYVPVFGRLGDDRIDHVLWKPKKLVEHVPLPAVDADLTCNTLGNHCGNAKLHTFDGNFFAVPREPVGTLSPFVNGWINEAPHGCGDQQQRHADKRSPSDAVHGGIL